ncbi:MAG: dGTP triphosphohydrolase [Deltaproteobacteria bacterium]
MHWKELLSTVRLGKEELKPGFSTKGRTIFQQDFDRILFSSAFRRLQNKTQVYPFPKSDYVRNRLTHSLETSSVGRSLGNLVGDYILEKHNELNDFFSFSDFGSIVSAACLAHDLGNPPFGHSGEDAISSYFRSDEAKKYLINLNEIEKADLQNFEGNAAGFRIITNTPESKSEIQGGLALTYATYASFVKYPKGSLPKISGNENASLKKFSYFNSEKEIFEKIADTLNLGKRKVDGIEFYNRYPLALLVETADDICYTLIDYEDGFHEGLLRFSEVEDAFISIIINEWETLKYQYNKIYDKTTKINYLRSKAINSLINQASEVFIENEENIIGGKFDRSLLDLIKVNKVINYIKKDSFDRIYSCDAVLKIEISGYKALPQLLSIFIDAVFNEKNTPNRKILKLIPDMYLAKGRNNFESDYDKLLNISMYIAGMTDKHAVDLYKQLNGISLD